MINDSDLKYNMALYMGLMNEKYESTKEKRKQLQILINNSAIRIQRIFRKWALRKKNKAAIKIQKWWKNMIKSIKQRQKRLRKFKHLYYGLIIFNFLRRYSNHCQNTSLGLSLPSTHKEKLKEKQQSLYSISYIDKVIYYFPNFIVRKSALFSENKYIAKYRQYLRNNFNKNWQNYEKMLIKQLWKEIDKKWVKIQSKNKNNPKSNQKWYLNDQDKQVNATKYVQNKLNQIYEENYQKMQATDSKLRDDEKQLLFCVEVLENKYKNAIII